MFNDYFQGSASVGDSNQKYYLINQLLEELQFVNISINTKNDILNALEIGLATLYPSLAVTMIEDLEILLDDALERNKIEFHQGGVRILPTSTSERVKFVGTTLKYRNFLSFLINFTNKGSKSQLVRNAATREEENSLVLEYYAFLSYNYALFLLEKDASRTICPTTEEIYLISANVFDRAYELDKEFIICSNVSELEAHYFACIKLLVDGHFKEPSNLIAQ